MSQPLYQCLCKATTCEDNEPRYSQNWAVARRAQFKIFEDRLECGDWTIPLGEIQQAFVYETKIMLMNVEVLHIITNDKSLQFGFNPWSKPMEYLNIPLERKPVNMKYSAFSIVLRVALLGWLLYYLYTRFGS